MATDETSKQDQAQQPASEQASGTAPDQVQDAPDVKTQGTETQGTETQGAGTQGAEKQDIQDADADLKEPSLADQLQAAREEADKFKDLALRAEAEMQNMQKRTARDIENAHKFGIERFLQNLLPIVDSIEKAMDAADTSLDNESLDNADKPDANSEALVAIAEGTRLCHRLLLDVLGKEGITVLEPVGEPFDPNEHEAMSMVENPDMEPNSVLAVVQKGYKLNGRLIRPAMVMVAQALGKEAPSAADTAGTEASTTESTTKQSTIKEATKKEATKKEAAKEAAKEATKEGEGKAGKA